MHGVPRREPLLCARLVVVQWHVPGRLRLLVWLDQRLCRWLVLGFRRKLMHSLQRWDLRSHSGLRLHSMRRERRQLLSSRLHHDYRRSVSGRLVQRGHWLGWLLLCVLCEYVLNSRPRSLQRLPDRLLIGGRLVDLYHKCWLLRPQPESYGLLHI